MRRRRCQDPFEEPTAPAGRRPRRRRVRDPETGRRASPWKSGTRGDTARPTRLPDETVAGRNRRFVVALPEGRRCLPVAVEAARSAAAHALAQRVVPRLLAQVGEVRELELEVPVPAVWTGGKRLTLQFRLTLVPEEDDACRLRS